MKFIVIILKIENTFRVGGLAYYRPRPTRKTSHFDHVTLVLSSTEALHRPDPSRFLNFYKI